MSESATGRWLQVTRSIRIDEREIVEQFVRSPGPGGQNVNKVATAVELRFDASASPALSAEVRERLAKLAGRRLTADGVLVIDAHRYRTRERNREDARARLVDLLRRAAKPPIPRRATRPTRASQERRLAGKRERAGTKRARRSVSPDD
jgi:ribosome-associated protein